MATFKHLSLSEYNLYQNNYKQILLMVPVGIVNAI